MSCPRSARAALLAGALGVLTLAGAPTAALAHDNCARPASAAATSASPFTVLEAPKAGCASKFEAARTKFLQDWADPEDPFTRQASKSKGNAPKGSAPCVNGKAAGFFPCDGVDLLGFVSHSELGTTFVNDIWGWTDPETKKDYVMVGASNGTAFVDVSDAKRPQVLGMLPTASAEGSSSWRDIKVYEDHAFVVSEHTNHGVQVFDLTRLRDWPGTYTTYTADARYTGHGSAHNININEATGFAYSVGAGSFSTQPLPNTVVIDSGAAAGRYLANGAAFGPKPTQEGLSGDIAFAGLGCAPLTDFSAGSIALVDRGGCPFVEKARNAQAAGATALIVANTAAGTIFMGGAAADVKIPAVMVNQADGATIEDGLPASGTVLANDPPARCGDGLHIIDVRNPTSPTYAGCSQQDGYIHDTQCVVYDGPDTEFAGREICFNSNGIEYRANGQNFVSITDVTDKAKPVTLSRLPYEGSGYSHQGWLTEDQRFFLHGDEGDEVVNGVKTTTRVWDVSDLRAPSVKSVFRNDTTSIDHNLYTEGDLAYASNYTTGLRVYDTSDVAGSGLTEKAFFDVYPENDNTSFEGGTWSNFPYLRQKGVVAVSSIDRGLFLLQPRVSRAG